MDNPRFKNLLGSYISGELDEAELAEFINLIKQTEYNALLQSSIETSLTDKSFAGLSDPARGDMIFRNIRLNAGFQKSKVRRMFPWRRWAVAASVILLVGI